MPDTKPVLLASDVHFGAAPPAHEAAFLEWLDFAAVESSALIINGDLFDFWFEYRAGITRGHEALLSKLRAIVDSGLPVTLVGGNHDWWGGRYLTEEIGVEFLHAPERRTIAGHVCYLAHGDGLGAGDPGYLLSKAVLRSPLTRFAFGMLPVHVGDRMATEVSKTERRWTDRTDADIAHQKARSASLEQWATEKLAADPELDMVLLGHTHLPMLREPEPGRWYVNSGDWVFRQTWVTLQQGEPPRIDDWRERSS